MRKNVSGQVIGAQLVSASDGSAFTGSVTVSVTIDGGTQATGTVGSGACTHEGNGYHTYAPSQAETNGDLVAFTFTGSGAVPVTVQVYTSPTTGLLDAAGVRSAVGLASANLDTQLADLPTVAEFEARTLLAAAYFDPSADTVTVATNNDKTGYSLATAPLDAAGVRAAVGLASANLDTQLADIPTVAEFNARSLPSADYFVVGDYTAPDNANILLARQILGNKHNVTDNGNGTFTIVVRNDADDATVRTLVYNPTTGARTVS